MASHHDWIEEMKIKHDAEKPFAPENGSPLRFKVGDDVVFTNDYGASFQRKITGFVDKTTEPGTYALGGRYYIDSDSPWMSVTEAQLTPVN